MLTLTQLAILRFTPKEPAPGLPSQSVILSDAVEFLNDPTFDLRVAAHVMNTLHFLKLIEPARPYNGWVRSRYGHQEYLRTIRHLHGFSEELRQETYK